jgi:rod shape determining protein RodA
MESRSYKPFGTAVQPFAEPRARLLQIDFLLLAATIGLLVFSVITLNGAVVGAVQGGSGYFVMRQAAYGVVGLALMLLIARIDYSRLRELRLALYGTMLGLILLVLAAGGVTRGSRRWLELPFFRFQPSELGKVLLVLALSAFLLERVRRRSESEMTARIMLLALVPTLLVMAQPDIGTGIVYVAIALTVLFVSGTKWTHFATLGGLAAAAAVLVLVLAPAGRPVEGRSEPPRPSSRSCPKGTRTSSSPSSASSTASWAARSCCPSMPSSSGGPCGY